MARYSFAFEGQYLCTKCKDGDRWIHIKRYNWFTPDLRSKCQKCGTMNWPRSKEWHDYRRRYESCKTRDD